MSDPMRVAGHDVKAAFAALGIDLEYAHKVEMDVDVIRVWRYRQPYTGQSKVIETLTEVYVDWNTPKVK